MKIRSVAVFCGSKEGNNPLFARHTVELGKYIALLKLKLIYGGGSTGLMGLIADTWCWRKEGKCGPWASSPN